MKILVVTQYFWPENFKVNGLVEEWCRRGHEVIVLTGVPNYPKGQIFQSYLNHPSAYNEYKGAKIIRVPICARGQGSLRLILNYLSFVLSAIVFGPFYLRKNSVDVIFVFEPSPVTVGFPAVFLSKMKKAPVIFWVLDLWPETLMAISNFRSRYLISLVGKMVAFIYNQCTLVLGQSRGFLDGISKYCRDKSKIHYFPTWSEDFSVDSGVSLASEIPRLNNGFTILFTGNIGEAQDMSNVLGAAELLKDYPFIRWVIVGNGRRFDWLKFQVIERGLQGKVLLPGSFPPDRMPSFYAHADALLVSLKDDPVFSLTIPGKVSTYLMTGIPLLGMLDGEGAVIIRDANAGFVSKAGCASSLSKSVLTLASMSSEDRKQLGLNGKAYAQREFSRSHLMDQMEKLLVKAVKISKNQSMNIRK